MNKTGFENLRVYNLAQELADLIWEIVSKWDYFAKVTIGKQIVNSADSIGALVKNWKKNKELHFIAFPTHNIQLTKSNTQPTKKPKKL
jgi:hypothetical protein